jgi:PAS domain S-box-containing protein
MVDNIFSMWENSERMPLDVVMREAPIMCHSIDQKGYILNVSTFWADRLGYNPIEMIGRKSIDFLTPASRVYAEEVTLPEFFKLGRMSNVRYVFEHKDGTDVPVIMSAVAMANEGDFGRSIAVMWDNGIAAKLEEIRSALEQSAQDVATMRAELEGKHSAELSRILDRIKGLL